ncbi:MAG: hypothetical protein JWM87_2514 [Candidatus Eremiobacteraeota bacterium]|nr:hypothetical protein [Candidatus Eremiobacteraeota bacterium]
MQGQYVITQRAATMRALLAAFIFTMVPTISIATPAGDQPASACERELPAAGVNEAGPTASRAVYLRAARSEEVLARATLACGSKPPGNRKRDTALAASTYAEAFSYYACAQDARDRLRVERLARDLYERAGRLSGRDAKMRYYDLRILGMGGRGCMWAGH